MDARQTLLGAPQETGKTKFAVIIGAVAIVALTSGVAAGYLSQPATELYAPSATTVRPVVQTAAAPLNQMGAAQAPGAFAGAASAPAGAQTAMYAAPQMVNPSTTFATSSIAAFVGMMLGAGAMLLVRMGVSKQQPEPISMHAWSGSVYGVPTSTVEKPWTKYAEELKENARKIASPGRGILAADESNKTCGKRFESIGVENTEENRRAYREMLITAPGFAENISGVIMYEETLYQKDKSGKDFVKIINEQGALAGIKVDTGIAPLPGANDEGYTMGLDGLRERCQAYYQQGARFAKWRAVLRIDSSGLPSDRSVMANATGLAQYAAICQECGLVPIVEPEILMDGDHDIETAAAVAERVLTAVYDALAVCGVLLEGTLLKPNMVTPGVDSGIKATAEEVAYYTVRTFSRTVPAAVAGITFLSGGMSEEVASLNLNAMNAMDYERKPWVLTFSFGRALQATTLKTWGGKEANIPAAQAAFAERAKANGMAQLGTYVGTGKGTESLFVKGYKY